MDANENSTRTPMLLLASPVGPLLVTYDAAGVRTVRFWNSEDPPAPTRDAPARGDQMGTRVAAVIAGYFGGTQAEFTVPLSPVGTP
ncbi:MAG: hypothetical protein H0U67_07590, partial [Gemmatimonadetes bacterium]|nr:hypothetical protein [Gemmatimonadota bacterium]